MPYAGFNFYLATQDQTTFDPATMAVSNYNVFSFEILHEEGQIPTVDLTIKNPYIGLLAHGQPTWLWISYNPPPSSPYYGQVIPWFFGVLIGIPSNLFKETITVRYQARSVNFIANKQAVGETLKVAPYWDPIFLEEGKRDDPDAILEGWSGLYHFPRLPTTVNGVTDFQTTFTDILVGEDGLVIFQGPAALYDEVGMTIGEAPLANVQVQAKVKWTQRTFGFVAPPQPTSIASYTGQSFLEQWPKANQQLGSGWSVETSFVQDVYNVGLTVEASMSYKWQNPQLNNPITPLTDCSTLSQDYSHTYPLLSTPTALQYKLSEVGVGGICQPQGAVNQYGQPISINTPSKFSLNGVIIPCWFLNCTFSLRYDAKRDYTEEVVLSVTTNTQPILTAPLVQQDTLLITLQGADVGQPVIVVGAWSDFAGQPVGLGQIIYPNNPTTPGGLSYQRCVQAGTAGTTEPVFSDIPGTITIDGGVHWASMGPTPLTNLPGWNAASPVPFGQVICYEPVAFDANRGTFEATGDSVYYICTTAGTTNSAYSEQTWFPPPATSDITIVLPTQVPYIAGPAFDTTPGAFITDGSVVWESLGANPPMFAIPIGGTPLNVSANNYFPTARGQQSVEYLISRARAVLRKKARAVTVSWDCPIEDAMFLSCRQNATLYDNRLPGGVATGKIVKYALRADGKGKLRGHVEIGVPVGYGDHVSPNPGQPGYVSAGAMSKGGQVYVGNEAGPVQYALIDQDITYTPPTFRAFDDGLIFPLQSFPGTITQTITSGQQAELAPGFIVTTELTLAAAFIAANSAAISGDLLSASADLQTAYNTLNLQILLDNLAANPVWATLLLPPVTNGPFNGAYNVTTSQLEIPEGIDLSAPANAPI
jgi:hypothetical protein